MKVDRGSQPGHLLPQTEFEGTSQHANPEIDPMQTLALLTEVLDFKEENFELIFHSVYSMPRKG